MLRRPHMGVTSLPSLASRHRLRPCRRTTRKGNGIMPKQSMGVNPSGDKERDDVVELAYNLWRARGFHDGSPEKDLLTAIGNVGRKNFWPVFSGPRRPRREGQANLPGIETATTSVPSVAKSGRRNNRIFTVRKEVNRNEKATYNRKNAYYQSRN